MNSSFGSHFSGDSNSHQHHASSFSPGLTHPNALVDGVRPAHARPPFWSCHKVSAQERTQFLSHLFGAFLSEGERKVFWWADQIIQNYNGGVWDFYATGNGGHFMAARVLRRYSKVVLHPPSGEAVYVSELAAGLIVTLLTLAYLSFDLSERGYDASHLNTQYDLLFQFALQQPEAASIQLAIA